MIVCILMICGSTLDVVLANYFQAHSPVNASMEGRIVNTTQTQQSIPSNNSTGSGSGIASTSLNGFMAATLMAGAGLVSLL